MKNKLLIAILFFGLSSGVFCEQPDTDSVLVKISEKYQNADQLYMEQEVNFFESYTSTVPHETEHTILKKQHDKLYTKAFNQEKIVDKGLNLIVDHTAQYLIVDLMDKTTMERSIGFDLITVKKWSYKTDYQKIDEQTAKYIFYFKVGEHAKSEVWFNSNTYEVEKMVYYMNKPVPMHQNEAEEETAKRALPRVEMNIKKTNFLTHFSENEFNWKEFILIADDKIIPAEKYQQYTLINNIEQ